MKLKKYILPLLFCLPCFMQAKTITISRLTCEMQEGLVAVSYTHLDVYKRQCMIRAKDSMKAKI